MKSLFVHLINTVMLQRYLLINEIYLVLFSGVVVLSGVLFLISRA